MAGLPSQVHSPGSWRRKSRRARRSSTRRAGPFSSSGVAILARLLRKILGFFFSGKVLSRLIIIGVILALAGGTFLAVAIAVLSRNLPEPGKLIERTVAISTKIYDREGKVLLYDLHGDIKRTPIALDQIAPAAVKAALVAEDRDFYEHSGFDLKGILRSAFLNIFRGGPLRGGSTITQQFIKNAVLTREKTLTRKLKELVLSYKIENKFSKDEILNMYFNEIPYGSTLYGIEAAAQSFFQKSAKDLDLLEGAILAAIPQAPSRLSPYGAHADELTSRVRYILNSLVGEGYASKAEVDPYLEVDPLSKVKPRREEIKAPHFVFFVRDALIEKFGEEFVEQGGLKVTTTLDWNLQQIAEEEVLQGAEKNEKQYGGNNAALLAQDVRTGQILAMVGSRDYFNEEIDGNVNVTLRPRQPGSSFKPVVYAAAFEKGFTPDTPLWDVVTTFKTEPKDYEPHNYDDKEHGLLTMRQALAGSLNIPAVKTIYLTGINRVLDLADKLGYTTLKERSRFGLSLVLGGGEVKLLEHVNAFATFARDGKYIPTSSILRVEDSSGRVLEEWKPPRERQIIGSPYVRDLISILTDNSARAFVFGANSPLILGDRPVAAKTGTTNDWRDGWTLGFTPSLAVGVWAGNNDNTEMKRGADGVLVAAPIWNAFLRRALVGKPVESFPAPEPRPVANPILRGQGMGAVTLKIDTITNRLATEYTPAELTETRTYQVAHSLLYYLNKDNLGAPLPENPGTDPNFENFEAAVRRYGQQQGLRAEAPPTLYDDVHIPENFPSVAFVRPQNNENVAQSVLVEIAASARRGISKVELYLADEKVAELLQAPYTVTILTSALSSGAHTLRARAYDDVLNRVDAQIQIVK
ncbi:transglycosylase domain-containing protein [Candidatus Uhrbacteria bacterium]|nr:transglycosylase domain-containing protein [Candidatus Uhrbacteria bacterium]